MKQIIDLRSDTVTKPTKAMLNSIKIADLGDELYNEDNNTKLLETYCANYFAKEASLFLPSATMSNIIAAKCHVAPGEKILTHKNFYLSYYQNIIISDYVHTNLITLQKNELIEEQEIVDFFENQNYHYLENNIQLLWLENTVNQLAGKVYPYEKLKSLYSLSRKFKLPIHIDGARIFNTITEEKKPAHMYGRICDSLTVSFSKALACPFGAVLIGNKKFIDKARKIKKIIGGGLHQSGIISAMCLYALKNNIDRIHDDHVLTKKISQIVSKKTNLNVHAETNIIMLNLKKHQLTSTQFFKLLKKFNILTYPWSKYKLRLTIHKDITQKQGLYAANKIVDILNKYS